MYIENRSNSVTLAQALIRAGLTKSIVCKAASISGYEYDKLSRLSIHRPAA